MSEPNRCRTCGGCADHKGCCIANLERQNAELLRQIEVLKAGLDGIGYGRVADDGANPEDERNEMRNIARVALAKLTPKKKGA